MPNYPVDAADAAKRLTSGLDWERELSIALNGGYGTTKRTDALKDLRTALEYLAPPSRPFLVS